MLTALFALAALILLGSFFRRPRALWERAIVFLAVILMLAVLVAWGISFVAERA